MNTWDELGDTEEHAHSDGAHEETSNSSYTPSTETPLTIEEVEAMLEEQERLIKKVESEKEELLRQLGINEEELSQFLSERSNFSYEAWEVIQEQRRQIEKMLERKLERDSSEQARKKEKRGEKNKPFQPHRGHWIFVR